MREQFKVDLRGIVDILSHHLYSSERVYLREILQNARDAIESRIRIDESFVGGVAITPAVGNAPMVIRDNGVGLTDDEMRSLLATIGGSSKRDDFETQRRLFLGQFGIGLLSCFLVADTIDVRSRSARTDDAPTIHWVGHSDGTFDIAEAADPLPEPGTEVRITPRHGDAHWCSPETVTELVELFAEHLDVPITVDQHVLSQQTPPWGLDVEAQLQWCRERFGFEPMGIVTLDASLLGVKGLGFVLPYSAQPGHRTGDRLYARGMLVADTDDSLLPDWAFFCRGVFDVGSLPLTASRESLQESSSLRVIRDQLGQRILQELIQVHGAYPEVYERLVTLHATGLKSLSLDGVDMRDLITSTLPFPTTRGPMTITELQRAGDSIPFVTDSEKFAAMSDVAIHAGILLVDGSGTHDAALLRRVDEVDGTERFREVDVDALVEMVRPAPATDQRAGARLARRVESHLEGEELQVQVSAFEPAARPVLWWPSRASLVDGGEVAGDGSATLVLNAANDAVRALMSSDVPDSVVGPAARVLLTVALLQGRAGATVDQATRLSEASQAMILAAAVDSAPNGVVAPPPPGAP